MADYWIKLYHEIIDDPKMATMPDRLWRILSSRRTAPAMHILAIDAVWQRWYI